MALGLTSVTFRALSCDEIIALAKEAGCDCIEWGGDVHVTDIHIAACVREKCAAAGIAVHSFGSYYRLGEGREDSFPGVCEIARALGAHTVRVWLGNAGSKATDESCFKALTQEAVRLGGIAAGYGLTVAFEFHKNTLNDTGEVSDRFLFCVGLDNVKTYWQPMYAGKDMDNLKAVLPNTVVVHLFKWNRLGVRYPLSHGEKEIRGFLGVLKEANYGGDIILEFVKGDSPSRFLMDFKTLKGWWE